MLLLEPLLQGVIIQEVAIEDGEELLLAPFVHPTSAFRQKDVAHWE